MNMNFKEFFQLYIEDANLAEKLKTRSTKETWKLANDIRKNPEDHDPKELINILCDNYNVQQGYTVSLQNYATSYLEMYSYDAQNGFAVYDDTHGANVLVGVQHDLENIPYFFKFQSKDMKDVYNHGRIGTRDAINLIYSYVCKKIGEISRAKRTIEEIEYDEPKKVSGSRRRKGGGSFKSLLRNAKLEDDDDDDSYKAFHDLISQHVGNDENVPASASHVPKNEEKKKQEKDKIEQNTKTLKKYKFDEKDYVNIFKLYDIKTTDIYRSLIQTSFDLPKHPSEIPKELHNIPRHLLKALYYHDATPIILAKDSARGGTTEFTSYAQHYASNWIRITAPNNAVEHQPTKKEAYSWLEDLGKTNNKNKGRITNFPSWLFSKTTNIQEDDLPNISFQSWLTFRWYLHNHKSTYFTKTQDVHGPAGRVDKIDPMSIITRILDVDLTNGVKTSPAKAYQNSAERLAKEWEERNQNTTFVNYPRQYKDTPHVRVVWSVDELRDEGERLNHCVGGYGPSCESGSSLILRLANSTAELDPKTLNIYQHRGTGNGSPPAEDIEHLKEWLDLNRTK